MDGKAGTGWSPSNAWQDQMYSIDVLIHGKEWLVKCQGRGSDVSFERGRWSRRRDRKVFQKKRKLFCFRRKEGITCTCDAWWPEVAIKVFVKERYEYGLER